MAGSISEAEKIVENEMEVISSRELIAQVVKNLNLYAPVHEEEYLTGDSMWPAVRVIMGKAIKTAFVDSL